jgi:hypothetical protein
MYGERGAVQPMPMPGYVKLRGDPSHPQSGDQLVIHQTGIHKKKGEVLKVTNHHQSHQNFLHLQLLSML